MIIPKWVMEWTYIYSKTETWLFTTHTPAHATTNTSHSVRTHHTHKPRHPPTTKHTHTHHMDGEAVIQMHAWKKWTLSARNCVQKAGYGSKNSRLLTENENPSHPIEAPYGVISVSITYLSSDIWAHLCLYAFVAEWRISCLDSLTGPRPDEPTSELLVQPSPGTACHLLTSSGQSWAFWDATACPGTGWCSDCPSTSSAFSGCERRICGTPFWCLSAPSTRAD